MDNVVENRHSDPSSITRLDCISHSASTFGKGMNPTCLPPAMGKMLKQTELFSLGMVISLEEEKLRIQTC